MYKKWYLLALTMMAGLANIQAQCSMCRTQLVNNVSHGETTFAAGLNTGILYLFFTPYILIGVIVFLWFRHSRQNEGKKRAASHL